MLQKMSGKYSMYEIFTDWIRCGALAMSNSCYLLHNSIWKEREQAYLDTMRKYSQDEQIMHVKMLAYMAEAMGEEMSDVLGDIYMKSGMGSKASGQFFTPYHLSELCAELVIPKPDSDGKIRINEPTCGAGGMIIAVAAVLKKQGFNYQRDLEVVAQDLDWKSVYMCYLQLSLLGIRAVCVQGDTLADPYIPGKTDPAHILYTPARMGVLV